MTANQLIEAAKKTGLLQYGYELAIEWRKPEVIVYQTRGLWVLLKRFDTKDWPRPEIEQHIKTWLKGDYPTWLPERRQ